MPIQQIYIITHHIKCDVFNARHHFIQFYRSIFRCFFFLHAERNERYVYSIGFTSTFAILQLFSGSFVIGQNTSAQNASCVESRIRNQVLIQMVCYSIERDKELIFRFCSIRYTSSIHTQRKIYRRLSNDGFRKNVSKMRVFPKSAKNGFLKAVIYTNELLSSLTYHNHNAPHFCAQYRQRLLHSHFQGVSYLYRA